MKKPGPFHWLRHLLWLEPCEYVDSIAGGVAVKVRCTMCGREKWLE